MKKIILPTDFSENAYNAIRYAVQLFNEVETTFYLLHTYTPAIYQTEYVLDNPGQIGLGDIFQKNSQSQLEGLKTKLKEEFDNPAHTFIPHSALSFLVDEVRETIKNEKIDLVIMGTQGATGAKEILLGTHAVNVIKKATCPVIVVPSGYAYEIPTEILFPTDYEIDYQKVQLQQLLDIAKNHNGIIAVIHVSSGYDLTENQLKNKQKLKALLSGTPHRFHDLPSQEIITAINGFQVKKPMNLLVMVQNKHTFFERLFIEPTIKRIGFHVTIPFMVIPHLDK